MVISIIQKYGLKMLSLTPATLIALLVTCSPALAVTLKNEQWSVEIEPRTLAVVAKPADEAPVDVSTGGSPHEVSSMKTTGDTAQWQWGDAAWQLSAHLSGSDLELSIAAKVASPLVILNQPARAIGKGLLWPRAEGAYVPAGDATWRDFLLKNYNEFSTTDDISLPLWGMDYGNYTLSWILTEPFDNQGKFQLDGDGLAISLEHQFTPLSYKTPMTLMLHLGNADDLLSGARRYRAWLTQTGQYETLADKLTRTPDSAKLIGAPFVYLWGDGLLATRDIRNWAGFINILNGSSELAREIKKNFPDDQRAVLSKLSDAPKPIQQQELVNAVDEALDNLAHQSWETDNPDMDVLSRRYGELRAAVARTFAGTLAGAPGDWGGGLSRKSIQTIKKSGLTRLWIGNGSGFEGGLWHPEAIQAGVDAGYLMAPYDSYQTALKAGEHPSFSTAQLGGKVFNDCVIVLANGQIKTGFQKSGHYTTPDCVRPFMQARVRAILKATPYNSWFLDAYGCGMVFNSFSKTQPISQAEYANGNIGNMRWISERLQLPTGSECGNAVTAQGLIFAHGMESPGFIWGDPDLADKSSPYFLGRSFPSDEPESLFKPVPVKDIYRHVNFTPAMRVPLYQAVFHGSVIATDHWSGDSLKFLGVRVDRELMQLLYNVPPIYHLSAGTLQTRLPIIARQDAFFLPLHQRLVEKALTGFRWLTPDHQVQQTTFDDGTRLIANFADTPFHQDNLDLSAHSIAALIPGEDKPVFYTATMAPQKWGEVQPGAMLFPMETNFSKNVAIGGSIPLP